MTSQLTPLRCHCRHRDIVAMYNDTTVEIKHKNHKVRLSVIDGKLQEGPYTDEEEKVLRGAFVSE